MSKSFLDPNNPEDREIMIRLANSGFMPDSTQGPNRYQDDLEKAEKTVEILDQMEAEGRFHGLTEDQKELERQKLGILIRKGL